MSEEQGVYLFSDGNRINFEIIKLNNINFKRETGALRIRITSTEINVDFLEETKPTEEQISAIEKLKLPNKKLFFEIIDKENYPILGFGGFDKTIDEMKQQLNEFYKLRDK